MDSPSPSTAPIPSANTLQNLRKGIDSFIAEEQARQRAHQQGQQGTPPRSGTASASRVARQAAGAPGARSGGGSRPRTPDQRQGGPTSDPTSRELPPKGPDPVEFEQPEFVIGDEDGGSRSSTPANAPSRTGTPNPGQAAARAKELVVDKVESEQGAEDGEGVEAREEGKAGKEVELPADVRSKLRKLDRMESRYSGTWQLCRTRLFSLIVDRTPQVLSRRAQPRLSGGDLRSGPP